MNKIKNKYIFLPIITAVLSLAFLIFVSNTFKVSSNKLYTNFLKDVSLNTISTVYVTTSPKIQVKLKDGTIYETDNPRTNNFKEVLLKDGINVSEQALTSPLEVASISGFVISLIVLGCMCFKPAKRKTKGMFSASNLDVTAVSDIGFNFENVAGNEEAKDSVQDVVDFLKNPEKYSAYGARMPRGVILYGDPGTGKTLLAKAVAGEANVPFYAVSGSDFVQIYVGVGAGRIRSLFKKARSHGRAVIFIDEIDAIGKKRDNGTGGGSDEKDQTLNALLTEMSGFNETEGIIIIAATNRLDMLDEALLRPGRFDRHIEVTLPDVSAREKILKLHLKNKPIKDIDYSEWAHKTSYFSGAKLENLTNEAAIIACKDNSTFIENEHLDKAYSIMLAGYEKVDRDYIKDDDRKITAFHEAGHALISLKMLPKDKVSKVTIIPTTKGAGGYTLSIPEDKLYQNKDYIKKKIMVLLGGRAAEEIIFGRDHVTTGAYSDLQRSTQLITNMITEYGMGESLGLLTMAKLKESGFTNQDDVFSECKNLISQLYDEVINILTNEKESLKSISSLLIKKETIDHEDLISIIDNTVKIEDENIHEIG
ncbi:ATP-dependent metallopeptidase FtsH/Yme1/Tma family protein [Clostridium estertheticum]|uniref:ATP-dependent metallopeptidase FtsH/Yme1/Tma family protein n=1 Tax=Clostridium estertheticum TaxID=238834 RepID=UPI001CF3B897|nr:ATP-dependent metallopeptidase FtsH/Yme1/Tma family protein [Clostridium estertheticum]MCB2305979.1 ATP-dependent metallopeptidase FtsH/Yme1/Tma family protein [Clostridium estertheticum]MCB2345552.1 ATP-dependent metallopeptidase FtsH/Yme1/Tma family protein [Clostridium estertheticum]MCB2349049.1 ATP-dependent metallopeptidase FtsH/Yme1/Tma family protein [Clostridium estertheticum]WAG47688.1 ATP-dependent metallopeptidase FtsH/Yme1/Tma family protein [Clostridium estertheticum]